MFAYTIIYLLINRTSLNRSFRVFIFGFSNGGPAGLVYGYLFCWIGTLATVASLAEMASMMPLSGGQYHWVSILAPARWAKFLSYITGLKNEDFQKFQLMSAQDG